MNADRVISLKEFFERRNVITIDNTECSIVNFIDAMI